jgi:hypothetical protein
MRLWPSGCGSCMTWFPRPFVLRDRQSNQYERHQGHIAGRTGSRLVHGAKYPDSQRKYDRGEINAAFATLERGRTDALFVGGDAFFLSRRAQFATLTARDRIPATFALREYVKSAFIRARSSKAPSPPSCRCCSRPNSSSSSTVKRRKRSASSSRLGCSQSPTR